MEGHIQTPMQPVLDLPMATNRLCESGRIRGERTDEIPLFRSDAAVGLPQRFHHRHTLDARPCLERPSLRRRKSHATPLFRAAMPASLGRMPPIGKVLVVRPFRHIEAILDLLVQRALIALESQHVVRALFHDCLRNLLLASHRIDRDRSSVQFQCVNQFRYRRDFIRFLRRLPLTHGDSATAHERAHYMDRLLAASPIMRVACRLAIQRHDLSRQRGTQRFHPPQKARLKFRAAQRCKHPADRVMRGDTIFQRYMLPQPVQPFLAPFFNRFPIIHAAEHRAQRQEQYVRQSMHRPTDNSRVRQRFKAVFQRLQSNFHFHRIPPGKTQSKRYFPFVYNPFFKSLIVNEFWCGSPAADEVIAVATTITGSIGVFAILPTAEKLLDKIGVHTAGTTTTWLGGAYDPRRPIDPRFAALVQTGINHIYDDFTTKAAHARKTTPQKIDEVAQGRVWTGQQAKERGLIDTVGSYDDALKSAATRAKLGADYRVAYIEPEPSKFNRLFNLIGGSAARVLNEHFQLSLVPAGMTPAGAREITKELSWLADLADGRKTFMAMTHCLCGEP